MKFFLPFLFSVCFLSVASSQDISSERNSNTIYIGYPFGFFDSPDFGIYLGYNKEFKMKSRFSWEGQAAFTFGSYERDSGTFARNGGSIYGLALMVGPRLYLMKPEKKSRLFINVLLGPGYFYCSEYRNDGVVPGEFLIEENTFTLGYSLGGYLQINDKFVFGSALETGSFWIFKFGYKF